MTAPDTRDSVELLPCPFCGCAADWCPGSDNENWAGVTCKACGVTLDDQGAHCADHAREAWNRRTLPQQAGGEDHTPEEIASVVSDLHTLAKDGWVVASIAANLIEKLHPLQAEVARRTDSVIVVGATSLACSSAVKEMFDLMSQRAEAAEAALREAHTLPETWRNKWDGGCCCDAAGQECADALDAAIGGTGDA